MTGQDGARHSGGGHHRGIGRAFFVASFSVCAVAVGVALCACGGSGEGPAASAPKPAPSTVATRPVPEATTPPPASDPEPLPEDTVEAFYDAAARGDLEGVRRLLAPEAEFDAGRLAAWGSPDPVIDLVTAGPTEGELWIEVTERGDGGMPGTTTTFTLVLSHDAWTIADWSKGQVTEKDEFGEGAVVNPQLTRDEQAGLEVVLEFLGARAVGSVSHMRELSTARMEKGHASLFRMRAYDAEVSVTRAWTEGGAVVIETSEKWDSKKETHEYLCVEKDGTMLVDDRR